MVIDGCSAHTETQAHTEIETQRDRHKERERERERERHTHTRTHTDTHGRKLTESLLKAWGFVVDKGDELQGVDN